MACQKTIGDDNNYSPISDQICWVLHEETVYLEKMQATTSQQQQDTNNNLEKTIRYKQGLQKNIGFRWISYTKGLQLQ